MKNSWALITGASSGFGRAVAEMLAARGVNLILTARRAQRLEQLKHKLVTHHKVQVETLIFDVRDLHQCKRALEEKSDLVSKVSILINNAGLARGLARLHEGKTEDWDEMIDTNVKGLLYMTRLIVPHMVTRNEGHIVNLGSVAGRWVLANTTVYCATKFAVRAISDGLRMDLLGTRIRVSNIEPGIAETEFAHIRLRDDQKADAVYKGITPLSAEEVAEAIVWCLERPPHVNIHEMVIFPVAQAGVGPHYLHREPAK
jgi:NADP-dependent 3-hydroxy acid dehydrogenase YdfG